MDNFNGMIHALPCISYDISKSSSKFQRLFNASHLADANLQVAVGQSVVKIDDGSLLIPLSGMWVVYDIKGDIQVVQSLVTEVRLCMISIILTSFMGVIESDKDADILHLTGGLINPFLGCAGRMTSETADKLMKWSITILQNGIEKELGPINRVIKYSSPQVDQMMSTIEDLSGPLSPDDFLKITSSDKFGDKNEC